jgi:hypothetical protein
LPSTLSSEYAVRDQPSIIINGDTGGVTPNFAGDSLAIYDFRNTLAAYSSGFPPPSIYLGKSRSGVPGTPGGIVQSGDVLGALSFIGDNGTSFSTQGAYIGGEVDGTPSGTSIPGRITFGTTTGGSANPTERMRITSSGFLGIGTTHPGSTLEVNGNIAISAGASGAHITFADGSTQSTAYTGVACGGDYAESVDVAGDRTTYEPGDVLVIGAGSASDVVRSEEPYSTLVAGIYSTKPGVVGRRQTTDPKLSKTEIPMAMVGIVPTKVSAENGPIKRGDLLVTSSTLGYAMKGTDPSRLQGAVVGKALGALDSGKGVIEVLVTLQ